MIATLAPRGIDLNRHRVRTSEDLTCEVALAARSFPRRLADASIRALRIEVVNKALAEGGLGLIGRVATTAGYQRRLAARFARWTRTGRLPSNPPPGLDDDEIQATEWRLFGAYRAVLRALDAEDAEGFHLTASRRLADRPPAWFRDLTALVVDGPSFDDPLVPYLLAATCNLEQGVELLVRYDPDRPDVFTEAADFITTQIDLDVGVEEVELADDRPAGLVALGGALFTEDPAQGQLVEADGLRVISAPLGEPMGREIARQVREWLDDGVAPEDLLVVFREVGDALEQVARSLTAWGVPVSAPVRRSLASDPAVAALLLAARLPSTDWDSTDLVGLLRNGQVRPSWSELGRDRLALAKTAAIVRDLRVFRGRDAIRAALAKEASRLPDRTDPDNRRRELRADRARAGLPIFDRLFDLLDREAHLGNRPDLARALTRIAGGLGLDLTSPGLDALLGAVDDHVAAVTDLVGDEERQPWSRFIADVEAMARDLEAPPPPSAPSAVRLLTVEESLGLRPRCLVLADLVEGKFPRRAAADQALGPEPSRAFAREMALFLEMIGLPSEVLALAQPTTDEKGRELLPAGFLDEAKRLFSDDAWRACERVVRRVDPALLDTPSEDPAEARVRAVALAAYRGETQALQLLAASSEHREVLHAVADSLDVIHMRGRGRPFGAFDGRLGPEAAAILHRDFAAGARVFSPSQLESLAFCPFQFFAKYVLHLEPVEFRDEIDSDYAASGRRIHRVLERLHLQVRDMADDGRSLLERVERVLPTVLDQVIAEETDEDSSIGLIEARRLMRTGRRYLRQFQEYLEKDGQGTKTELCEYGFGRDEKGPMPLQIGDGQDFILVRGTIDRIDGTRNDEGLLFRVIDYKSGTSPSKNDLLAGTALQLPLYALAVERLSGASEPAVLLDAGYWALKENGYKKVLVMEQDGRYVIDWRSHRLGLETYIMELVQRLREGQVPVAPRVKDCEPYCDYRHVCRIRDVREAAKEWPERPVLERKEPL